MPQISIKLFASLNAFLPEGARQNEAAIECADGDTVQSVLDRLNVPRENCHLVVVNGVFVPPDQRPAKTLAGGDALAVWPPVAGG